MWFISQKYDFITEVCFFLYPSYVKKNIINISLEKQEAFFFILLKVNVRNLKV